MFSLVGDHMEEIINLPNRMYIKIDFGDNDSFGSESCNRGISRRVRLFDKKDKIIAETIETNPNFRPSAKFPEGFFDGSDPKILY